MKVKAKLKKGNVEVKVLAKSPMAGKEEAKLKKIDVEFITHMTARANGKVVWEVSTGPFLSKNPYMQFAFNAEKAGVKKGDKVDVDWVDNKGKTAKKSQKIK
ncbi:MAG: thiosulfate oxidation carrier complex protein SoxZ [Sulfurimonas sp.]|uniref:thiosulfate oxidation carrier complex protein SoxZ n=1 Tax=Sulfurimonas sp. TaxID=2022749 RepID=UPI002639F8C9|nr:thiosulfate oxidation carrier complex protein SoxZ [Sulfurimonas sp.]MCW8896379.1 thiosulfate oxidation carrier complex protein SoxZ [Sulfurimonas sp.]MCW8953431.1 thiosulfate oxidation carrier complex protein SoxZ [Sulfurimonas sp.]